jgi:hypothetical protein
MHRQRIGKGTYAVQSGMQASGPEPNEIVGQALERAFERTSDDFEIELIEEPEAEVKPEAETLEEEIRQLTPAQLVSLKEYARWRMTWLGPRAAGRDHEDLISEAVSATLAGERARREGIALYQHLIGAMRSISSKWFNKKRPDVQIESDLINPAEAAAPNLLERAATNINPERVLSAKEKLERVRKLFSNDLICSKVVELLALGYSEAGIRTELQISKQQYGTALKRIRRKLALHFGV